MSAKPERRLDRTLAALGDPTRRAIVDRLRRAPERAGELAQALGVSAPALSRHLRVLRGSDLVEVVADEADARARIYRLRREPFGELRGWLDDVEAFWVDQLGSFSDHVSRTRPPRGRGRR